MRALPNLLEVLTSHLFEYDDFENRWVFGDTALVQSSQFFFNNDNAVVRMTDGANTIFNSLCQMAFNGLGNAICVGTGYVALRDALHSNGGWEVIAGMILYLDTRPALSFFVLTQCGCVVTVWVCCRGQSDISCTECKGVEEQGSGCKSR